MHAQGGKDTVGVDMCGRYPTSFIDLPGRQIAGKYCLLDFIDLPGRHIAGKYCLLDFNLFF